MRIFVGHDSTQPENTEVCVKSLERFGLTVELLDRRVLKETYGYDRGVEDGSTEFAYTRFLVPFLCDYKGMALFCDSDFLWRKSPIQMLGHYQEDIAVSVVHHLIKMVREDVKFSNNKNEWYPRKWWSSMMLFNCSHEDNKKLTVEAVNTQTAAWLHRFGWTDKLGRLPETYNWLAGYYHPDADPMAVHFTDGTPIHQKYRNEPFAEEYLDLLRSNTW
jgi:hypothetical protein